MTLTELAAVDSRQISPEIPGEILRRNLLPMNETSEWSSSEELGIAEARDLLDRLESHRVTRKEVTLTDSGRMRVRWVA